MDPLDVYLSGPFFSTSQEEFVTRLEELLTNKGLHFFSPRRGANAVEMNAILGAGAQPGPKLRHRVFLDNMLNIDKAMLLVAFIDDFDTGTLWELGYAYKAEIPAITVTNQSYEMNLLLADSVIGHCKGIEDLSLALDLFRPALNRHLPATEAAEVISRVQAQFLRYGGAAP